MILTNYPVGVHAAQISAAEQLSGTLVIRDVNGDDVTENLVAAGILVFRTRGVHGYVDNVFAATTYAVKETYYAMSESFNAGETPVFFARVVNSTNSAPLTQSSVASIMMTIYTYVGNNVRSSAGAGYKPIESWEDVALDVGSVIVNEPAADPRCPGFVPNLVYEPNTLSDNPFADAGNYRAVFTITPQSGNRIPVVINVRVN